MAEQRGVDGVVKFGSNTLLHVTSWSLDESSETLDITQMGSAHRNVLATFKSFSGSVDAFWDTADSSFGHTDAVDPTVVAGDTVAFELYPEGEGSGMDFYSGSAIVSSISRSASFDGAVEMSISFEGTGALNFGQVA
jgi:predicted secreted protein